MSTASRNETIEIRTVSRRTSDSIAQLAGLWNDSVRATHHFLTEDNIRQLQPYVIEGLKTIPVLSVATVGNSIVGFIGIAGKKIEMLFVSSCCINKGIGRELVKWGQRKYGIRYIDVNEQNEHAVAVYRHWGFSVYERTGIDEQGNPFPILKMELKH